MRGRSSCSARPVGARRDTRAATSRSEGAGATTCCSRSSRRTCTPPFPGGARSTTDAARERDLRTLPSLRTGDYHQPRGRDEIAMEPDDRRVGSEELLPLASIRDPVTAPDALAEGPVRFLLVSGDLDDGRWGLIGAFWLSIDGSRGGFVVAPQAIWQGSEMARSFRGALSRHWHA